MAVFYHKEPQNTPKKCKFLSSCLKDPFSYCLAFSERFSIPNLEEDDYSLSEFDDEQEVVVSAIRSGAIEKLRKKSTVAPMMLSEGLSWVNSPMSKELYMTTPKGYVNDIEQANETEEFLSVKSCFSCSSSYGATSRDVFVSVKSSFSRSSGLFDELNEFQRRSIMIRQFCECQGWPFGLCRRAVLLPPLPKSPSESWLWCKKNQMLNY